MPVGGIEIPSSEQEQQDAYAQKQGVYFVLEQATLEVAKVGKGYDLLNSDDHHTFLKRHKKEPAHYRPDITHQALLTILDSPANKAGKIKGIYVHTFKNVLIQVSPQVRLPRTYKRFAGLMVQLLQKLSIRATNGPDKLLKVIKGPVGRYLPSGAHRIGFSRSAPKVIPMHVHPAIDRAEPLVFVLGAFSHGKIDEGLVDEYISISQYPLSAAYAIARITTSLEIKWSIT
jgi:rRNA small subunit pseudouridine methyltransferase Nep1